MFNGLAAAEADALHGVMRRFRADPRKEKCDLGVGVFRDNAGECPIMRSVAQAELMLARLGGTKAYLPLAGDGNFLDQMIQLFLPLERARTAMIQATGGTGALRLALELTRLANPDARVHLGLPSWPSHRGLVEAVQLQLVSHDYFDPATRAPDVQSILDAASRCRSGDLFILHGPCHNPTGADLKRSDRDNILNLLAERGAVPLIDAAYWGLSEGLEADLGSLREDLAPFERAFLAASCSKSFGLYRERTAVLFVLAASEKERDVVQTQLERLSRVLVSMPPAHGAAVVSQILSDEALRQDWINELEAMRSRILSLRSELERLSEQSPQLTGLSAGRGIFALLPIGAGDAEQLVRDHAIHLPSSGRINVTGLKDGDAERLASALQGP